jgi:hypothetical protein
MNMQAATKSGEYTEKVLTDNFLNIAKGFKSMDNRIDMLDNGVRHLSGHIAELFQMAEASAKVQAKTPSRFKPFVVGAVVGIVAYRYAKVNARKIEKIKQEAKAQIDSFVAEQKKSEDRSDATVG